MRMMLALLIACLALPAMAAPHAAHAIPPRPMTMTMAHEHPSGHDMPAPDPIAPKHECIGCIPPTYGLARVIRPQRFAPFRPVTTNVPVRAGALSLPATPPPRTLL